MRRTLAAVLAVACVAAPSVAVAKRLHLHRPKRGFQMRMEGFEVVPGGDREGCQHLVTPNRKPIDVAAFELRTTPGTHHFVVWEYLGQDHAPGDFWKGLAFTPACIGLGPQDGAATTANLFGMLAGNATVLFPPGVAARLDAHADVYANLHYHNYAPTPVTTGAVFNFIRARRGTVKHHAQAFTVGSFDIHIPPHATATITGDWHAPADLNLVSISTHQHRRGTGVRVDRIDAAGNDLGELVESPNWEHPTVDWYTNALRIPAGGGLRFTCDWQNDDDHAVTFGVTSEDEMCFVTGYFYPDEDGAHVTGPGCAAQGAGLECFVPAS
jgi:hypothetical protein